MALAVANRARVRPRLGCFAASCRVRTRPLVAAPRALARPVAAARLALPFTQGTNASDLAAAALSASPAGSTPAAPSVRLAQHPPSFVRVNPPRFDPTRVRVCDRECKPKEVRVSGVAMEDM